MNLKYVPFLGLLVFLSCSFKERVYENQYLKLVLPDGWMITEKDNSKDSRWLVSTLIPTDEKFFNDSTTESPIQNFIVVAVDSAKMADKYGPMDFSPYCRGTYERQKARCVEVSEFDTTELKGKKTFYWKSKILREGKNPLIQEQYMLQLPPYYASFQLTHSLKGKTTDSEKILNSIVFKK